MKRIDLSIIIVSYNTKKITLECVKSVIQYTKEVSFEIIIIDNNSSDESVSAIAKLNNSKIKIIQNTENKGFGRANNQGIKEAKGRYVLFLNSDTLLEGTVLDRMIMWMDERPDIGISSCKLLNKDHSVQGTGGYFPTLPRVFSWMTIQDLPFVDSIIKPFHPMKEKSFIKGDTFYTSPKELDWVTGAFMLVRSEVFDSVSGFDNDYFMYTEEVDFCYRAKKKNWKVYYNPKWSIIHYGGASGTVEKSIAQEFEGVKLFYQKHYSRLSYTLLRYLLMIGALGRIIVFGLKDGSSSARIYRNVLKTI